MRTDDIYAITVAVMVCIAVVAGLLYCFFGDSDVGFMSRTGDRPKREDVLPPPPPKPKVCRCAYCKGVMSIYKERCCNCGALNMEYRPKDNYLIPNVPRSERQQID